MSYNGKAGAFPASNGADVFRRVARETGAALRARGESPPKRARSSRRSTRRRRNATVPGRISFPAITKKNPIGLSRTEKLVGGAAGLSQAGKARAALSKLGPAAAELGRRSVGSLPKGGVLGVAAIAGLAAYAVTTALINRAARTKEELRENAFQLSQAYRRLRLAIEEKQGRPLTAAQQRQAAAAFKKQLLEMGLSSHDLRKLNPGFFS